MTKQEYLQQIDAVIANGKYKDNWQSLYNHPTPQWLNEGKFGIFIHWGVYSVPAFGSEWYPRAMYTQGSPEYYHHIKTYGADFGYKDFIPMFKAEKFNADEWLDLFAKSGAKYVMPVAEHHDGFQMYASDLSKWNAAQMGPCRDICGELREASDKHGITFCASTHRAEHYWFLNGGRAYDCDVSRGEYEDFYGPAQAGGEDTHVIWSSPASEEFLEDWLVRTCELIDKYQPQCVFFDWWIHNLSFKPYTKKFAAYYYNRAAEWGKEVTINYKYNAYPLGTATYDIERGQLSGINPRVWQTDTSIAKNSWGYTENNDFKKAEEIVCDLVDIVSKNGVLLLNVGPKSDGTITAEEQETLLNIGKWLQVNGEGIYGSTYWSTFGEGPTEVSEGAFTDVDRTPFTPEDIRFTYKQGYIYAFVMKFPKNNVIKIKSLKFNQGRGNEFDIENIEILGHDPSVAFVRDEQCLTVYSKAFIYSNYPVCLKIKIN